MLLPSRNGSPRDTFAEWFPGLLVLGTALLASGTTLWGGFVFDDLQNVVGNSWIRSPSGLFKAFTHQVAGFDAAYSTSYYRPLMHVFYAATYAVFELRAWAYHLVNVALHAANTLLALVLARRWFFRDSMAGDRKTFAAVAGGLIFACHPVHVEAIAWIAGITDLSATFFSLLSLLAYERADGPRVLRPSILSAGFYLLAALCKESAFLLPMIPLAIELFLREKSRRISLRNALPKLVPFFVAGSVYLVLRIHALQGVAPSLRPSQLDVAGSVGSGLWLLVRYVGLLLVPHGLSALHPFHPVLSLGEFRALAGLVVAGLSGAALASPRLPGVVRIGLVILFLPLVPVLYVRALGEGVLAERYLYLPVLGLGILAGWALSKIPRRAVRWTLLGGIVVSLAVGSIARNRVWRDNVSLWSDAVRESPTNAAAHEFLGYALLEARRPAEAAESCRRALALDTGRNGARINLGVALSAEGKLDDSILAFRDALARQPASPEAWTGLGLVQMAKGQADQAVASYRSALASDPDYAEANNCLGVALARAGRVGEAREYLVRAVRSAPENPDYRANLRTVNGGGPE